MVTEVVTRAAAGRAGPAPGFETGAWWPLRWAYWPVDRLVRGPSGRLCFMDFAYDDRTQDLRERLLAFMTERVYPAEPVFREQEETNEAAGRIWDRLPVT